MIRHIKNELNRTKINVYKLYVRQPNIDFKCQLHLKKAIKNSAINSSIKGYLLTLLTYER